MILKKLAIISSLVLTLSACASNTNDAALISPGVYENPAGEVLVCRVPLQLDTIEPINWRDFEWKVLNDTIVQEMLDNGESVRYYALSPQDFQNLSVTQQDILRYLRVQREQLNRTIEYYSDDDNSIDE